jgi:uncharacterized damage-inducible protein DinB
MVELLRSLFRHQAWADEALLGAVQAHPESMADEVLFKVLHHIVMVQGFFLCCFTEQAFDPAKATELPKSFEELVQLFKETHAKEQAFLDGLTLEVLERRFDLKFLGVSPTVAVGMTQVVMHSQNHRGQCLTRIRENGGKPPTLDYILWAKDHGAGAGTGD